MMYGWTWDHWPGMGPGWGGLLMLLIWVAAVAGAVVLARWLLRRDSAPPDDRALTLLNERYARGEIGRDEYLQKRQDLEA
jgi:putative membrane protein